MEVLYKINFCVYWKSKMAATANRFLPHDRNSQWRSFTKLTFVFIENPRWQPLQIFFLPFEMSSLCEPMVFNHTQTMNFDCSSSFYSL